jgi:uncharacterized Zn finger protein
MSREDLFQPQILERGYDYYLENYVAETNVENNMIHAKVYGSDTYDVEIDFSNGKVQTMLCDCPYASEGKNCKHMAAVLYEWDSSMQSSQHSTMDKGEIAKIIQTVDEETLRTFLEEILSEDKRLLERLKLRIPKDQSDSSNLDKNHYLELVDDIFVTYMDEDDFIDYYQASDFTVELYDFLENNIKSLIATKNNQLTFEVVCYLVEILGFQEIDDSDGGITYIMGECVEIW